MIKKTPFIDNLWMWPSLICRFIHLMTDALLLFGLCNVFLIQRQPQKLRIKEKTGPNERRKRKQTNWTRLLSQLRGRQLSKKGVNGDETGRPATKFTFKIWSWSVYVFYFAFFVMRTMLNISTCLFILHLYMFIFIA